MRRRMYLWLGVLLATTLVALTLAGCAAPTRSLEAAPSGAPQEGIQVHGAWTIEVTNPDGTLAERREFDNALTVTGGWNLADVLSRQRSVGGWLIRAGNNVAANSPFFDPAAPTSGLDCWVVESASSSTQAWVFENLTVTAPSSGTNAHKVVLSGTATAQRNGSINQVYSALWTLAPTSPPSGTYSGGGLDFTGTTLTTAVSVSTGQQVAVTVVISFS